MDHRLQRNKATGIVWIGLLVVAVHGFLLAQAPPDQTEPVTTIVKSVGEVSLDLVARGKKNKPVLDLQASDIAVTDNGAPVNLSSFRLVTGDAGSRLITLVFDRMESAASGNAFEIAGKILDTVPVGGGFSFAVLRVDGRLRLLQEFTADRTALRAAIRLATKGKPQEFQSASAQAEKKLIAVAQTGSDLTAVKVTDPERKVAEVLLASLEESQRMMQGAVSQPSLSALLALTRTQRQVPGRKVVIYFAQGLAVDPNTNDMLLSIVGAANRAGVSLYPVDANPMTLELDQSMQAAVALGNAKVAFAQNVTPARDSAGNPAPQAVPGLATSMKFGVDRSQTELLGATRDPLSEVAGGTGGAYIRAGDNLRKPLQRMVEDLNTYYEISYAPPTEEYDGKFRPVTVKPLRKGIKIQSRAGYFAQPPGTGFGTRPFEAPLVKILAGEQFPADLRFRIAPVRLGELPDGNANAVVVEVPITELEMKKDDNANLFSVHVAILAQIKRSDGSILERFSEDIPKRGDLDALKGNGSDVIGLQRHFTAPPGKYVLEVAVQDRANGKAAAQRTEFEIPNVSEGPALSDLVLVRRTDPFTWESDPLEPLRYEDGRVVPNLAGQVSPDTKEISLFFMVHPDAAAADQARLEMALLRNGEPVGRMPLQLHQGVGQRVVPYLASIQARALSPGRYEAIAILTHGGRTVQNSTSFRVQGPELASATPMNTQNGSSANDHLAPVISDSPHSAGIAVVDTPRLVITALPPSAVHAPTSEEAQALWEGARKRAVAYSESLPDFTCIEGTSRSEDATGRGHWRHKDSRAERLQYRDNTETRTTLAVDGKPSTAKREDIKGPISVGEFGGLLALVFSPAAKATFKWREAASLGAGTVQVFDYRVAKENATIALGESGQRVFAGFHGLVYIENATMGVRRITLEADDLPANFSMRSASMAVDYNYVALGNHELLMPVQASVGVQMGKRKMILNEIVFRDFKRFGAETKITYDPQSD
jgi:VWFA-related protein